MRRAILVWCMLSVLITPCVRGADAPTTIEIIATPQSVVSQYTGIEVAATIPLAYTRPFDQRDIDVSLIVTTPDGATVTVPAFFTGQGALWKARYTPVMVGRFAYHVRAATPRQSATSVVRRFYVAAGKKDGFIRRSTHNPYYFAYDSGKPFYGIGHNVAWTNDSSVSAFERYFDDLQSHGCTLTRIWMNVRWGLPFEERALGKYNFESAQKLDAIMRAAAERNLAVILVFDSYSSLMNERGQWNEESWQANPYNSANGGPCQTPEDFFTDAAAKAHYKNRLRYIVSRWGYVPDLLAFELWNEYDAPAAWTQEMASYIKSIDTHQHLVTTSLGYPWANNFDEGAIWRLPEIDIIQSHIYGNIIGDAIGTIVLLNRELSARYEKPVFVGEFGINSNEGDAAYDGRGTGVTLHNSLWASIASRGAASALNWWWAEYIRPKNLYPQYQAAANFVTNVPWNSSRVDLLTVSPVIRAPGTYRQTAPSAITITTKDLWANTNFREFTIANNGDVSGGFITRYLYGTVTKQFQFDPIFHLTYPTAGQCIINVGMVSQGGTLVVFVDDKEVLRRDFPVGPGEGPWIKSMCHPVQKVYQCLYNTDIAIDMPAGEHTLRLANPGKDWIGIKSLTLTNYKSAALANTRTSAVMVGDTGIIWIQNKDYTLALAQEGREPAALTNTSCTVGPLERGIYRIEWWDTYKGRKIREETEVATDTGLHLSIPAFTKDIAAKIVRRP